MKKWECLICGYIHEGEEPPDECPICGAGPDQFVEVKSPEGQKVADTMESSLPKEKPLASPPRQEAAEEASPPGAASESAAKPVQEPPPLLETAGRLIVEHHLHPIAVHSPNGIIPVAFIFFLLAVLFHSVALDKAAFFNLIVVLLSMPLVLFTGYTAWQRKYRGAMTSVFKIKITASVVATALLCILIAWRAAQPEVITTASSGRWFFLFLSVLLLGAVGIAGHLGGKLVFGGKK